MGSKSSQANAKGPVSERRAIAPASAAVRIPEGIEIPTTDGVVSRCGDVALHPVLDGVSGIVEGSFR